VEREGVVDFTPAVNGGILALKKKYLADGPTRRVQLWQPSTRRAIAIPDDDDDDTNETVPAVAGRQRRSRVPSQALAAISPRLPAGYFAGTVRRG